MFPLGQRQPGLQAGVNGRGALQFLLQCAAQSRLFRPGLAQIAFGAGQQRGGLGGQAEGHAQFKVERTIVAGIADSYKPEELVGNINVAPEMGYVMGVAIYYVGSEPCTTDKEALKKMLDLSPREMAVFAPLIAPHDPFDPASLNLMDGFSRPMTPNEFTGNLYWLGADDQVLFDALRAWRLEKAREEKVSPFIVAYDTVIAEIAERRPRNEQELLSVAGIGPGKVEKYGEDILAIVSEEGTD